MLNIIKRNYSTIVSMLVYILIRFLYTRLVLMCLTNVYYPGAGSYGISFNAEKEAVSLLIFLLVSLVYSKIRVGNNFMHVLLHTLFILYYIPLNSSYAINDMSFLYLLCSNAFFLLLIICAARSKSEHYESVQLNTLDEQYFYYFLCFICIIFICYKFSYNGLSFSLSINSTDVYSTRSEYTDYLAGISGSIGAYFLTILKNLTPIASFVVLAISLREKKIFGIILSAFTVLCTFSISSSKSTLFSFIVTIVIYIFCKKGWQSYYKNVFSLAILSLIVISIVAKSIFGNSFIFSIFLRREMYLPSWLNTMYYDFFSNNPKLYFSDSAFLLQKMIPKVYSMTPIQLISQNYFSGVAASPNTGLFAEAYMQLGILGVFVYPFIVSAIIKFINKSFVAYCDEIRLVIAFKIAISLTNIPILRTDFILSSVLVAIIARFIVLIKKPKVRFKDNARQNKTIFVKATPHRKYLSRNAENML